MSVPPNVTDPENDPAVMRVVRARVAMQFYDQNRTVTNFPYFLAAAEAEEKPDTVVARKILWQADQARKSVRGRLEAVKLYKQGLEAWKNVLRANPAFHRPERSDRTEEESYEYELEYLRLAGDDPAVAAKAKEEYEKAVRAVAPWLPTAPELPPTGREDLYAEVAERYFSPFAKPMDNGDPWIKDDVKQSVRTRQGGLIKPTEPQPANAIQPPGGPPGGPGPGR